MIVGVKLRAPTVRRYLVCRRLPCSSSKMPKRVFGLEARGGMGPLCMHCTARNEAFLTTVLTTLVVSTIQWSRTSPGADLIPKRAFG